MRKYTFIALMFAFLPLFSIAQTALTLSVTGYNAKCNGSANGSAVAAAAGGVAPYSYIWAPAATGVSDSVGGLAAGIYSVTVTDSNGNTASGSVTISQPASLIVGIDSIIVPPCFRTTSGACGCYNTLWAVVSGGTTPYSYLWTPASTGSNTEDTLNSACYVDFTVAVTDSNGCIATDSITITVPGPIYLPSGVAGITGPSGINAYPNPANNQLNVSIDQSVAGNSDLAVYNIMGEKVFEQQLNSSESLVSIDVSKFAAGNYLLRIVGDQSQKTVQFSISR